MNDIVTKPEAEFAAHLAQGRFMLQRSKSTGKVFFYPRVMAPGTGEQDLEWIEASGRGTVYSTTVIRKKPPEPSYNVALIDLDDGPRMMSRVEGVAPDAVPIGARVRAFIGEGPEGPTVLFTLEG